MRVVTALSKLESVPPFSEFVKAFDPCSNQMILAYLTGDRQNVGSLKNGFSNKYSRKDLKDKRRRSQLSASRTILEQCLF
ncbi:unnamed protein product [Didymodactylos carnosus]|uniref:Uncharacterized protein n=1 Tax=Didymodactylos carnosus TaxID=1234261 RepID=A0A815WGR0_9BILA|nr:unnamed protein product [Didymodactylos carnosus]CAF4404401.1 unnamed protein product [Didymodactylos carnosus]